MVPVYAKLREKANKLTLRYTQKELAIIVEYLTKSAELWEEERNKLVEKKL